jgi:hypothetical protein
VELFKKESSKYWWYDFTVRGQRYRGSTEETNENRAKKIASLKLAAVLEGSDPLLKKAPVLRDFSQRFLEWVDNAPLVDKSTTYYQNGWGLLSRTNVAGMRLDLITNDQVEQLKFPGGDATRNTAISTLSRMLHRAEDWKVIRRSPELKRAKEHERLLCLDDQREEKLLAGAAACNWQRKTLALFTDIVERRTGLRNERELFCIRIENLDFERKVIFVPDSKTETGIRLVPMSDLVHEVLLRRCGNKAVIRKKAGFSPRSARNAVIGPRLASISVRLVGRPAFPRNWYFIAGGTILVLACTTRRETLSS